MSEIRRVLKLLPPQSLQGKWKEMYQSGIPYHIIAQREDRPIGVVKGALRKVGIIIDDGDIPWEQVYTCQECRYKVYVKPCPICGARRAKSDNDSGRNQRVGGTVSGARYSSFG